jgi:hypothetical protein
MSPRRTARFDLRAARGGNDDNPRHIRQSCQFHWIAGDQPGLTRLIDRTLMPRTGSDAVDPTRTLASPHDQSGAVNSASEDGG